MKPPGDRDNNRDKPSNSEKPEKKEKEKEKTTRKVRAIFYKYPIAVVLALRTKIKEAVELEFLDKTPQGSSFVRLVELVQELLPGDVPYETLEDSLRSVAGSVLTAKKLDALSWRLAGNHKRLKQRRVVPPWHIQKLPEWVPAQIVSCRRERSGSGRLGARFGFRILAGTPAGLTAYKWWSLKFGRFMSQDFGYSRPNRSRQSPYPYSAPEQLVGLRLYIRIMPKESGREPGFDTVGFPSSINIWNKTALKCRFRSQDGFVCQMAMLPSELPCHKCPIGFLQCRAGTHRANWIKKECPKCEQEAFFDPEIEGNLCIGCFAKEAYRNDAK